jgi:inorganic triphosphatase YgiF
MPAALRSGAIRFWTSSVAALDADYREIELKFAVDPAKGPEVLDWLRQGRRPSERTLIATYFDTSGGDLRRAGYSLRVRRDGDAWTQTVKSGQAPGGGLGRGEWETPNAGPTPDLCAARRTPAAVALRRNARLVPQFMVETRRQAVEIRMPGVTIEACLDLGGVEADGRRTPVAEVELELQAGGPEMLFDLARRLRQAFNLKLSAVTKAERGFALMQGAGITARRFRRPPLSASMTTGEAFQAMARAALEQIVWNAEVIGAAPTAEAIHQARVGLRRLRATVWLFRKVVADGQLPGLRAGLKGLAGELSVARDLDVFSVGAWGKAAAANPALLSAQAAAHERASAAVVSEATGRLLLETLAWIETGPWTLPGAEGARRRDRPVKRFARRALDKGRERLLAADPRLSKTSPEARHRTRILAKRQRYGADVFDQLFTDHPRRAARFLAALSSLLGSLGDLNDIETARIMAPAFAGAEAALEPEAVREGELLAAAEAAFDTVRKTKPFWA